MTSKPVEAPTSAAAAAPREAPDLNGLRSHARQLHDDLEAIKAEIAALKAAFQPSGEPSKPIGAK